MPLPSLLSVLGFKHTARRTGFVIGLPLLVMMSLLLSGCANTPPTPSTIEVTRIVETTRIVEITREVMVEPGPTISPAMTFPADCLMRQSGVDYAVYDWLKFNPIGGCSHISPSPDGKYLAYSTRACPDASTCGEAVKIQSAGSMDSITIQFVAGKKWVSSLGWSSTGKLAVSYTSINSGAGVYVFGEPFAENFSEGEIVTEGDVRQWNESRTAFVTSWALGGGYCDSRVGGYDFNTGKAFPDIAVILGRDPLDLNILPFNSSYESTDWWIGENEIPLLITPLQYDSQKEDFKYLPTMVGKISITPGGPEYTTLAASPTESYFIAFTLGDEDFSAQPKTYHPVYCHE